MRVFVAFSRQDGDSAGVIFCGTRRGEKDFSFCSRLLGDSSHSLGMTWVAGNDKGMAEGYNEYRRRFFDALRLRMTYGGL